jgi:hypothetical protein
MNVHPPPATNQAHFHSARDLRPTQTVAAGADGTVQLEQRVQALVLEGLGLG